MMRDEVVISIMVFVGSILFLMGFISIYFMQERKKKIIDQIKSEGENLILRKKTDYGKDVQSTLGKIISSIGNTFKPKTEQNNSAIRRNLLQAGYRKHNAPAIFMGYKIFFAICLPVLFSVWKLLLITVFSPAFFMGLSIMLALTGFYLPNLWVKMKKAWRKDKIIEGFPDALDLMVICVEAGMGMDAVISRVGEEMKLRNKVVSEEFRLLSLELRAGKPRREALKNLGMRTGIDDVASLMTLLIQTDKFGTSVAQALRVHSDSMRTKRQQRAEEIAAKLPVKLVFPLILFMLPALLVTIVGPAVIKMIRVLKF
ncbi:MAG: type II secretion system F family protein [Nitrospiraceae bacterium]|nr:MAG: type II secretion system F family protein [Nitrospiraceae bacterium]